MIVDDAQMRSVGMLIWFSVRRHYLARWILIGSLVICSRDHAAASTAGCIIKVQAPATPPKLPVPLLRNLPENGLARTPPMGWASWNRFGHSVSDGLIREIADVLVTTGMRDAGYVYLEIDDGWQGKRGADGLLRSNDKFPDMKALSNYIHSKGLKFALYSSPGPKTCGGFEGSYGHEDQDAKTFAAWGVDYLKYDWCSANSIYAAPDEMRGVYQKMGEALRATGRPIVYSLCQYGLFKVWEWGGNAGGNLWRTTFDIQDNWKSISDIGFSQDGLESFAGPGHWNDPDMMEVGNGGMTIEEYRTHMTLWVILAAPLLVGNDPRIMTNDIKEILLNREVLDVNQDSLGRQGRRLVEYGTTEIWTKLLNGGAVAVALFNRGANLASVKVKWSELGMRGPHQIRDLWKRANLPDATDSYSIELPSHGSVLLKVTQ
jgi:alpha-galactosidase